MYLLGFLNVTIHFTACFNVLFSQVLFMMDYNDFDSADDDLRDEEYPDESDMMDDEDSEETDTVLCSACHAEVYEDSVQCPVCGEYLVSDTHPLSHWPVGYAIFGILGVIATIWVLLTLV